MNTLKEQNGRYYQECKVVMVATDNKTNITKIYLDADKTKSVLGANKPVNDNYKEYINLYITSNEEIKEGDWLVEGISSLFPFDVIKATKEDYDRCRENWQYGSCRKIIATTDETLCLTFNNGKTDLKFVLPKPSDSFISKYIEEYNKGNQITDVLVEYKWNGGRAGDYKMIPKIDSDNTITIKKVKDSYSREEVINLLYKYNDGIIDRYSQLTNKDLNKWIKENL